MPRRGGAGKLLADLNAEHASTVNEDITVPPAPEQATPNISNVTTLQDYNEYSNDYSNVSILESSNTPAKKRSNHSSKTETSERETRFRKGLQIAEEDEKQDEIAVLTIRLSPRLSRYVDQYVARRNLTDPKGSRKYRKQDAVAEAFAAFYADHEMPPAPVEEDL